MHRKNKTKSLLLFFVLATMTITAWQTGGGPPTQLDQTVLTK